MEPVIDWNGKAFKKMSNLKTLIIKNGQFSKSPKYFEGIDMGKISFEVSII